MINSSCCAFSDSIALIINKQPFFYTGLRSLLKDHRFVSKWRVALEVVFDRRSHNAIDLLIWYFPSKVRKSSANDMERHAVLIIRPLDPSDQSSIHTNFDMRKEQLHNHSHQPCILTVKPRIPITCLFSLTTSSKRTTFPSRQQSVNTSYYP